MPGAANVLKAPIVDSAFFICTKDMSAGCALNVGLLPMTASWVNARGDICSGRPGVVKKGNKFSPVFCNWLSVLSDRNWVTPEFNPRDWSCAKLRSERLGVNMFGLLRNMSTKNGFN